MFNKRLAEAQSAVEQQLMRWLTDTATPDRLSLAMRHAVLGGGKRVRPFLVLETAGLFDVDRHSGLDVAAALECVHCYSLVHDDLPAMDNDRLRRGKPTVWAAYDEWTAILAGDALLTLAFEIVADGAAALPAATRIKLIGELAAASGRSGMVGGQCLDLAAEKLAPAVSPTLDGIRRLQVMKTGALLRFACVAGAIMGDAGSSEHRALAAYGDGIGFAFQIADDLLDATGNQATVGKAVAKDDAAGKATLVALMGVDAARRKLDEVTAQAVAALDVFGGRAEALRQAAAFIANRTS